MASLTPPNSTVATASDASHSPSQYVEPSQQPSKSQHRIETSASSHNGSIPIQSFASQQTAPCLSDQTRSASLLLVNNVTPSNQQRRSAPFPKGARTPAFKKRKQTRDGPVSSRTTSAPPPPGRGNNFRQRELFSLLEILEDHLSVGNEEREAVQKIHDSRFPEMERNIDSPRRKFASLYRKSIPTCDPHIPPDVLKAKKIRVAITERIDLVDGEDAFEIAEQSFETQILMQDTDQANQCLEEETAEFSSSLNSEHPDSAQPAASVVPDIVVPSPHPLVRKRAPVNDMRGTDDLVSVYKLSLLEEQKRRAEEHERRMQDREKENKRRMQDREDERERREHERRMREEERADEKARREAEAKRHERMMDLILVMVCRKKSDSGPSNFSEES